MPFWSADGKRVLFWSADETMTSAPEGEASTDDPGADASDPAGRADTVPDIAEPGTAEADIAEAGTAAATSGVYGVSVDGGSPRYEAELPLGTHLGGRFTTLSDADQVVLTRTSDGESWTLDTGGATIALSVDGSRAAWAEGLERWVPGQAPPPLTHHVADLTSEGAMVSSVDAPTGYAIGDWTADGGWLMSLMDRGADRPALIRFDPETGEQETLFDGQRLRTGRSSPGRTWIAITRTYEPEPEDNAVYLLATDGATPPRRLKLSGGYRWRDDDRLLVVPQLPGDMSMELWEIDAASGAAIRLNLPADKPFRIAAGEWSVAPTGDHVAYRSAVDDAIWLVELP